MNDLDNAMQLMWQQKRNQLWKLSARLDNALIETLQRNDFEPREYVDIDKYSGFGNCKLTRSPLVAREQQSKCY